MNYRAAAAEFIGTFMLAFLVYLSLSFQLPVPTPVIAGLVLGTFVYTIGNISGAHLNPAVTLGLLSVGKVKVNDALGYLVAQCLAGFAASQAGMYITGGGTGLFGADSTFVVISEALGAFILIFGISGVVHGRVPKDAAGLTIGASLTLGILAASGGSYGVLNPAVALGVGALSFSYLLAPIGGALVGAWVFQGLLPKEKKVTAKAGGKKK